MSLFHDVGQVELAKVLALLAAHGGRVARRTVVVPAQVQNAVNRVQAQLRVHVVAAGRGLALRDLDADHDFPFELPGAAAAQRKREYVGRAVVVQEPLVQCGDGRVVHDREADLGFSHLLPGEHNPRAVLESGVFERDQFLRTGDRYADHSLSPSGAAARASGSSPRSGRAAFTRSMRCIRVAMWSASVAGSTVNGPVTPIRIGRRKSGRLPFVGGPPLKEK